jgi:endonuclease V-like protein UPF0215 family
MFFARLVHARRHVRVIGIDDAPFEKVAGAPVPLCGVICSGTRFEGMLWGTTTKDGLDGTEVLIRLLMQSKFAGQVHLVLLDGITVGGLNVIDLAALHEAVGVPCAAVLRKAPDVAAFRRVVERLPEPELRWSRVLRAGPVHERAPFWFQVVGADPDDLALALGSVTDRGNVPEPLRLAHLIGSAVISGESGKRA